MKTLTSLVAAWLITTAAIAQQHVITDYLVIKDALIAGKSEAAAAGVQALIATTTSDESLTAINKLAHKMSKASTLDKQREAFGELSQAVWKYVKQVDTKQKLYYQYCPMKKAYWVSTESTIKNPYYGATMRSCGSVVETKE